MNNDYSLTDSDLPTWMRQARQIADWGVVIVFFFSLMLAMPFLMQSDVPHTTDLENHVYMARSYADALREGRIYPRWIESALSGYGAPIGNYYPPATPYLTALVELFFTNDTLLALHLVAISAIVLCGMMTYLFALRLMRAEYAVLAGLLYVYSPFIGLTVPYILGDLPLLIASALLPMSLWSMGRVIACKNPLDRVFLALICAMLWLTHLEMAILTYGVLIAFLLMYRFTRPIELWRLVAILIALGAGLGLSAFFWFPAWSEQDLVTWIRAPYTRLMPIMTLQHIVAPITPIDLNQQVTIPSLGIGLGSIIFAILGVIGVIVAPLYRRWLWFWGIGGVILVVVAILFMPSDIWMMTPIAFCLAMFSSGAFALAHRIRWIPQRLFLPIGIVAICLLALPVWLAPRWDDESSTWSADAQISHEQLGYGIAVLPPNKPIPITLPLPIVPNRALVNGYLTDETGRVGDVVRIPQNRLTVSKQAGLIFSESHRDRYLIQTDTPSVFEVLRAYADGWVADVDGVPMSLTRNSATGLIQVGVGRAINGVLTISYEATSTRQTAWGVSAGIALFLLMSALLSALRRRRLTPLYELNLLSVQSARLVGIIGVGFGLFFMLFIAPQAPYSIYPPAGHRLNTFVGQNHKTDVGIELLGYQMITNQRTYQIGDSLTIQVAWRTARQLTDNYQVMVFLSDVNTRGLRWLQSEPRYLAGYPTRRWSQQKYLLDEYTIPLTDVLSAGEYRLVIEIYRCQITCLRENRVNFFTATGEFIGSQVALSPIFNVQ